jgi:hypothetical protein
LFFAAIFGFKLSLSSRAYLLINYLVEATLLMPLLPKTDGAIAWPGTPFMLSLIIYLNAHGMM